MATIVEQPQTSDFKLPARVASYPAVSKVIETGREYYNWGRENSFVVAYAESSLEEGIQWLESKVEPYLETAKPLLVLADGFGCTTLDSVETNALKFKEALEQVQQNYVTPVDEYLKDSFVARPLNIALNVTERVVDHYLPQKKEDGTLIHGPISKTTYLSKRIQHEAFAKLQHLSLRTPERLNAMEFTVDLIKYASQALDTGLISLNQTLSKSVETGTQYIKDAPKEVKEKIQTATHDALAAITTAVETLSNQIPTEIATKFGQFREATITKGEDQVKRFYSVAGNSSKLLHELSTSISSYTSRNEVIPQQVISSSFTNLHNILDSLLTLVEPKSVLVWSNETRATTAAKAN